MNNKNIKSVSFGCRLNALESEKIKKMLSSYVKNAVVVNTCAVTAEAERQSGQAVRKIARENPNTRIFVTGCAATRNPDLFRNISNTAVIHNKYKMDLTAYIPDAADLGNGEINDTVCIDSKLSKQFVQIQNGCNHNCAYCITRQLRGASVSFEYNDILAEVCAAVKNGFGEIVLTGIDIASYVNIYDSKPFLISDLCRALLNDVPEIKRLRLSSVDPAVPDIQNIIDLILQEPRMMPHLHFSMQSGADNILKSMGRRHTAQYVRNLVKRGGDKITFSWDIICGFPGETDELFTETLELIRETKPIKVHAFPFSPRPGTPAANMPEQIDKSVSKKRVKIINDTVSQLRTQFMKSQIGKTVQVLVEENNIARCPHDIAIKISGCPINARTICNVKLTDVDGEYFIGNII